MNRGWRFCRPYRVVIRSAWLRLLVPDDAWFSVVFGPYWTTSGLQHSGTGEPVTVAALEDAGQQAGSTVVAQGSPRGDRDRLKPSTVTTVSCRSHHSTTSTRPKRFGKLESSPKPQPRSRHALGFTVRTCGTVDDMRQKLKAFASPPPRSSRRSSEPSGASSSTGCAGCGPSAGARQHCDDDEHLHARGGCVAPQSHRSGRARIVRRFGPQWTTNGGRAGKRTAR